MKYLGGANPDLSYNTLLFKVYLQIVSHTEQQGRNFTFAYTIGNCYISDRIEIPITPNEDIAFLLRLSIKKIIE